ncbi:MAG TPA: DUF2807 domain-containing protein [Mucilaginibacter sp.]|jgi:hypothetical protein|nr:DUF2807 domain-containing protein [Mucilaginibacter sp.]
MKKSILTLAIALTSVLGISQAAFAANRSHDEVTVLTDISHISKIEVHGNVELYLSDGMTDNVKVYNSYYSENALVQNQNGVLKISSYKAQTLVVWITVSNLCNLSVYDSAQVKSFGKLSAIDLTINLYNDASAQLNMDAYAVNMKLNDHAKADLEGTITEAGFGYDYSASLNITNLSSERLVKKANSYYPANPVVEL